MVYCILYDIKYYIECIYNKYKDEKINVSKNIEDIKWLYTYYLLQNGEKTKSDEIIEKIIKEKYSSNKKRKIIEKECLDLDSINFSRKLMINTYQKEKNERKICKILIQDSRREVLVKCVKYMILSKYLKINLNLKIKRIYEWNKKRVMKNNTIKEILI